jgi:hypothetical protein
MFDVRPEGPLETTFDGPDEVLIGALDGPLDATSDGA